MSKVELDQTLKSLADALWDSGAFKTGAFKLKLHETNPNAPLSPYYISMRENDVKPGTFPMLCKNIATAIHQDALDALTHADFVVGIPKAGNPIAEALSRINGLPVLTMEKVETPEGRYISSVIHGDFKLGQRVLGIDDLITAADTKFEFKKGLEDNGLVLVHMGVALDREQGGVKKLREAGVSVSASLKVSQLLDYYLDTRRLDPSTYQGIIDYIASQK